MGEDQWQSVIVLRSNMNEVSTETIDLGTKLRVGVKTSLQPAHVVYVLPIVDESLRLRERHALRPIRDGFPYSASAFSRDAT